MILAAIDEGVFGQMHEGSLTLKHCRMATLFRAKPVPDKIAPAICQLNGRRLQFQPRGSRNPNIVPARR